MVGRPGAGKLYLESLGFMALVPFASSWCRDFVNLLTLFIGIRTTSVRSSTRRHFTPKYHKVNIVWGHYLGKTMLFAILNNQFYLIYDEQGL